MKQIMNIYKKNLILLVSYQLDMKDVPVWRTHGRYWKQMKRRFYTPPYHQRNKNKTILSGVKRMLGEHIASRLVKIQKREVMFRV